MENEPQLEVIYNPETGTILGQRKTYENNATDVRWLDGRGSYGPWMLENEAPEPAVIPELTQEEYEEYLRLKRAEVTAATGLEFDEETPDTIPDVEAVLKAMQNEEAEGELYGTAEQYQGEVAAADNFFEKHRIAEAINHNSLQGEDEEIQISQHEPGAKLDTGKRRPALVLGGFATSLDDVVDVGTYGAAKYSDDGWMHVPNGQKRYMDAAMRHWLSDLAGEERNPEDNNVKHLAQTIWNLLAVLSLRNRDGRKT